MSDSMSTASAWLFVLIVAAYLVAITLGLI